MSANEVPPVSREIDEPEPSGGIPAWAKMAAVFVVLAGAIADPREYVKRREPA